MIYLKFAVSKKHDHILSKTIETKQYSISQGPEGKRVYYDGAMWEAVGPNDWLNCFVMSDTGNTIDKIDTTHTKETQ